MIAAAILSMLISNTSTTHHDAMAVPSSQAGAVTATAWRAAHGIAAAPIGGLGTLVGSPTNAIAGLLDTMIGTQISFAEWSFYGFPIVLLGVRSRLSSSRGSSGLGHPFDVAAARAAVANEHRWSAERRLMIVVA